MTILPLSHPDVKDILFKLLNEILNESDRGAIIIGAAIVEDYLSDYIKQILPRQSRTYVNSLMKYPGLISSFSAKIELAYAFRIINEPIYKSLTALRKMRNNAAHDPATYSISQLRSQFDEIFSLGEGFNYHVKYEAMKIMTEFKMRGLEEIYNEYNFSLEQKAEHFQKLMEDKKLVESLERQIPRWELIFGLSLIIGIIAYMKDKTLEKIDGISTISEIGDLNEKGGEL